MNGPIHTLLRRGLPTNHRPKSGNPRQLPKESTYMNSLLTYDAIVLDLFGTLAQIPQTYARYDWLYEELNISKLYLKNILLTQNFQTLESLRIYLNSKPSNNWSKLTSQIEQEIDNAYLYEDAQRFLKTYKGVLPIYLLSNLSSPYKAVYERLALFKWIQTPFFSCDIGLKKPDSKIFEFVSQMIRSPKVLMIGDSLNSDYRGAKNAGWDALLLDRKGTKKGDSSIRSFEELLD